MVREIALLWHRSRYISGGRCRILCRAIQADHVVMLLSLFLPRTLVIRYLKGSGKRGETMRQKIGYLHRGLLLAAVIHLILYASLLVKSVGLNFQDTNAIGFVIFLTIVPTLLAGVPPTKFPFCWWYPTIDR